MHISHMELMSGYHYNFEQHQVVGHHGDLGVAALIQLAAVTIGSPESQTEQELVQ